ncbi:aspartyl protease family protein [Qipengyuania sp. GH1]|uniref:aspartyl protease family protein n=1 Tax=Qipengyuania aestuarii TaxID=2867241 RepID=UPI001C879203|nr:aspartyl protease family protein [Qipengyuania aestuarii]MBX7535165.1 aspartyl protease family protein [Qipengyuania aestuarii]
MMHRPAIIAAGIAALASATAVQAQMAPEAVAALQEPVAVERKNNVETIPLVPHMGKFAIQAALNGHARSFVFDTGSPTLISRDFADELNLTVIGSNTGRDANGRAVTTEIAVVEQLTIGGLTFSNVPVLIADFNLSDPDGCFFDGGVIGSEIFPGSVWHIDGEAQTMQIAGNIEDISGLEYTTAVAVTQLHLGSYPYAPVFDYAFGAFEDRALFDTGNSDTLVLFDQVIQDRRIQRSIVSDSLHKGRGSHGVSAGGMGSANDLLRFEVENLKVGSLLPPLSATTRNAPPSLIGLGILDRYNVTLDYPGERLLLSERAAPAIRAEHPGYAIMVVEGAARVVQLFEGSSAQRAGLELGDEVIAIDGHSLLGREEPCNVVQWLVEEHPTSSAEKVTVVRNGQSVVLSLGHE